MTTQNPFRRRLRVIESRLVARWMNETGRTEYDIQCRIDFEAVLKQGLKINRMACIYSINEALDNFDIAKACYENESLELWEERERMLDGLSES